MKKEKHELLTDNVFPKYYSPYRNIWAHSYGYSDGQDLIFLDPCAISINVNDDAFTKLGQGSDTHSLYA